MVFIIGDKEEGEAIKIILLAAKTDMSKVIFTLSEKPRDEIRENQMNKLLYIK